jgi:hypothetical protein
MTTNIGVVYKRSTIIFVFYIEFLHSEELYKLYIEPLILMIDECH